MNKIIYFLILLSLNAVGQNKNTEKVYVLIDKEKFQDLYRFGKQENSATIKILMFKNKDQGFNKSKKQVSNSDIVVFDAEPHSIYYEFNSSGTPETKNNIDDINLFSIEDISKENKNVWKEYPYKMIFVEKLDCNKYKFWKMSVVMNE